MKKRPLQLTATLLQLFFATVTVAVNSQTTERVSEAAERAAVDALPRTAFFATDAAVARGKPGTLIRSEEFAGYDLPADVRATRILYRSRSELDHEVVASAVVIVPTRAAPPGGWPVLIWAHGVTGVAQKCAPSLSKSLGPGTQTLIKEGVARGFAVVAVDYSGLGAGSQHEYLWKMANAKDIIFAAPAARTAQPQLASSWVAMGYSEGGQAAWGVAEAMATLHDPSYRGAVALAPTIDTETLLPRVGGIPGQSFYPVYAAFGIKAVYPNFDTHSILLPAAVRAYPRLTGQECRLVGSVLFEPVKLPAVLDARWTAAPLVQRLITENLVGKKPIAGPMLVAGADGDDTIPAQLLASRVKELCATGAAVDYQVYPGDHESMLVTSFSDQMSWIMDRFQERKSAGNCK
jgi:alpha-beta hydrolase superfamily lysophospholipase